MWQVDAALTVETDVAGRAPQSRAVRVGGAVSWPQVAADTSHQPGTAARPLLSRFDLGEVRVGETAARYVRVHNPSDSRPV